MAFSSWYIYSQISLGATYPIEGWVVNLLIRFCTIGLLHLGWPDGDTFTLQPAVHFSRGCMGAPAPAFSDLGGSSQCIWQMMSCRWQDPRSLLIFLYYLSDIGPISSFYTYNLYFKPCHSFVFYNKLGPLQVIYSVIKGIRCDVESMHIILCSTLGEFTHSVLGWKWTGGGIGIYFLIKINSNSFWPKLETNDTITFS